MKDISTSYGFDYTAKMNDKKETKQKTQDAAAQAKSAALFYLSEAYVPYLIFIGLSITLNVFIPISPLPQFITLYAGLIFFGIGACFSYWTIRKIQSFGVTWEPLKIESQDLIVQSVYHYTRNPMFIGATIIYCSLFILLNNLWGLIFLLPLVKTLSLFVIRPREERFLAEYGETYEMYHSRTARWI